MKALEIGPGRNRLKGFDTLDLVGRPTYKADATGPLPIESGTYDLVYASHVLEHMPWPQIDRILAEWVRIIRSGGRLEVWVPNAALLAQVLLEADKPPDPVLKYNPEKSVVKWVSWRMYGSGEPHMWHKSLFTPAYLRQVLTHAGLVDVGSLPEPRGIDHGIINLGMGGTRP